MKVLNATLRIPRKVVEFTGVDSCKGLVGEIGRSGFYYLWNLHMDRPLYLNLGDYVDVTEEGNPTVIARDDFLMHYTLPEYDLSGIEVAEK